MPTLRHVVLCLSLWLVVSPSAADAGTVPCKAVGNIVVCDRPAFDTLIDRMRADESDLDRKEARLVVANREVLDLKMALSGCLTDVRDRRRPYPVVPMIFALVGGGIIGASIMASGDGRLAGLVVGSAMAGTGLVVALF